MRLIPILVFSVCTIAAVGLYLGFSYFPGQHRIKDALQIRAEVEKELNRLEKVSSQLPDVQNKLAQAEARWHEEVEFLYTEEEAQEFKSWLWTAPKKNGLSATLNFSPARYRSFYLEIPFKQTLVGSSSGFKKFLAQWERKQDAIGVSQMNILKEDAGLIRATIAGALYIKRPDYD